MLALVATAAVAQDAADLTAPNGRWEQRRRNGADLYEAGMYTGAAGLGGIVAGMAATIALLVADDGDNEAGIGLGVAAILLGSVAIEVGAPIALAGSRQERTALKRLALAPERGGTTPADVGWALYAGQLLLPPLLVGSYACAAGQHADNQSVAGRMAMAPAVGVRARF